MYHCHIRFYFLGNQQKLFHIIKEISPLEHFTHEFCESSHADEKMAKAADVIIADVHELDAVKTVQMLVSCKQKEAELIVLAGQGQTALFADCLSRIQDVWVLPMTEEEIKFRFTRWQQTCKMSRDYWQTSQYLEAAINSIPNLVWYKTKDGIHKKVNDSFCKTVNKTKEQVQGRGHAYIWDVEHDDPACIESEREVMQSRKTCVSEETVETSSGVRLLTTYKSPLYDLDGSVMGTVGVGIDITQEQAYREELIRKTQTLETLFMTMDCGIICHSVDGARVISINNAALRILGYESYEEMVDDGFDMVAMTVLDEDKPVLRESIRSLEKEGDSANVEYRVKHENGDLLYVMGNIKLVRENGELFYQRFLLDCTAQKLREHMMQEENERQRTELIQALSIDYSLVCFFDLDTREGNALRINDCKYHVLDSLFMGDLELEECMTQYIDRCVHPEDKEMVREMLSQDGLKKELFHKKIQYVNYRTVCGDKTRYFQMKAVRMGEWDKNRSVVLGFRCVDEETRNEMEQKNLLQDALLQANRASKAKSVFLSNMSHDIRTPMNAIIGFTTLAIRHIDCREQVEEYLKKIMTSGNHLLSLINDVLDMSRIESGKMNLTEQLCSLPDILHGLRNIVQADIHAKQLELYMDAIDVVNEDIYCDRLRLNQVLLNLLSNSIKYTGAGGIVSLKVVEKGNAPVGFANYEFHIRDTGIGMSEEFISRIFEPFERERNSTISGIQGTGLGMAITKNIVDMMNGTIRVESEQGAGTEFIVSFMFRLSEESKESPDIPELKNCRALVVDDDFNTCDSVSCMLQQIGMRAEWTLSGKEAVLRTRQAVMRHDNYFVYVIDWMLPDVNGVEVARRIRKETGEDVPIIVMTAYDWADIEEEAKEAGITAFCSKPLFLSELRGCLHSIVNEDDGQDAGASRKPEQSHSGRILLVEDNVLNQEIAQAILEESGFTTEIADNGKIAVDMLGGSRPGYYQLVLMDIQMPVMNGHEAARAIRSLENKELASIPILAMTANAFEEDKQEALKSGMNGHIAKPINIDALLKALDGLM